MTAEILPPRRSSFRNIWALVAVLAFTAVGCVHALDSNEVVRVTTCKNTDLKAIRKNLLLAGYEIKSASDTDLTTDYKQVAGYSSDKTARRITVVKMDDKTYRFNVRLKSSRVERNQNNAGYQDPNKKNGTTINIDMSQPIEVQNDYDQAYYQEHVAEYDNTHREVCGN